jgi:hypothetical protein
MGSRGERRVGGTHLVAGNGDAVEVVRAREARAHLEVAHDEALAEDLGHRWAEHGLERELTEHRQRLV